MCIRDRSRAIAVRRVLSGWRRLLCAFICRRIIPVSYTHLDVYKRQDEDIIYKDIEDEIEKNLLNAAISRLEPRERKIVELRFGLTSEDGSEMTQKEVADLLGISQSYISRLEKKIMKRLKKEMVKFE